MESSRGERVAIIGGGAWGTALSIILAGAAGRTIHLWVRERELALAMAEDRENTMFLPGLRVPEGVMVTSHLEEALAGASLVLSVLPSHGVADIMGRCASLIGEEALVVSATKGLDPHRLCTMSVLIEEALGHRGRVGVLTGPTLAWEVARGLPGAAVLAHPDIQVAGEMARRLHNPVLRLEPSCDPLGAELGGALKNVVAIASGLVMGLQAGENAQAALMAIGLGEMSALALAAGGQAKTLYGMAGLGDLILTCQSPRSRNFQLGRSLAGGRQRQGQSVAEGARTALSAVRLAARLGVPAPLMSMVSAILSGAEPPQSILSLVRPCRCVPPCLEVCGGAP